MKFDNSMTGRAYIGEVLNTNLAEEIRQTSECIKRELERTSGVHESSRKPMKKVHNENERKMDDIYKIITRMAEPTSGY